MSTEANPAKPTVWSWLSFASFVIVLLFSAVVIYVMKTSGRSFLKMFVEMKMTLPPLTQLALAPWVQWIVPVITLAGLLKEFLIPDRRITLALNVIQFLMVLAVFTTFREAMFLPLFHMIKLMSSSN